MIGIRDRPIFGYRFPFEGRRQTISDMQQIIKKILRAACSEVRGHCQVKCDYHARQKHLQISSGTRLMVWAPTPHELLLDSGFQAEKRARP